MPYIEQKRQADLLNRKVEPENPGDFTFLIFKAHLEEFAKTDKKYADRIAFINAAFIQYFAAVNMGNEPMQLAYLGTALELVRRYLFPYEAKKMAENGDINMELQMKEHVKAPKKAKAVSKKAVKKKTKKKGE
jgi:hypothetical protein